MWYTLTTAGTLFHFDYATETFDGVYPLPTPLNGVLGCMVSKIDGNVYLAEMLGQAITKFDVKTKRFTRYPLPIDGLGPAVIRAETENRYIWITGFLSNSNIRFDTKTKKIDVFTDPLLASFPAENTVDSQGRVWYRPRRETPSNILTRIMSLLSSICLTMASHLHLAFLLALILRLPMDQAMLYTLDRC